MRLWHENMLPRLPRQQLLGQHRECAALRGSGWGRPHMTVNYVFTHSPYKLYQYHLLVMQEMKRRGYQPDPLWYDSLYRGKSTPAYSELSEVTLTSPIYPEHDQHYWVECEENLKGKGVLI